MSDEWSKLTIDYQDTKVEMDLIIGWLSYYGAESVVEQEGILEVYVGRDSADTLVSNLESNASLSGIKVSKEEVENKNWNEVWESNFEPIQIGKVGIRAEFHEPIDAEMEIVIQPKMAFGTGHHETTYMMIEYISQLDMYEKSLLDYGCGTGILTVLAAKQGAKPIVAIDMQVEATENTKEHLDLNNIPSNSIKIYQSDISLLNDDKYNIILANINRHVLLSKAQEIKDRLEDNGTIIMSGILKSDEKKVRVLYEGLKFELVHTEYREEWCLFVFRVG